MGKTKHTNKHHLLYQRLHWKVGYASLLRRHFVYELPVDIHNELHRELHDIPLPPGRELSKMWPPPPDLDILEACQWLISQSRDGAFKACMRKQYKFLKQRLG